MKRSIAKEKTPQGGVRRGKIEPDTPSEAPAQPRPTRKRRSEVACSAVDKIRQLPGEARELVNKSLSDALSSEHIAVKLTEAGHPGINGSDIENWKLGGYKNWVRERERIENLRMRSDAACHMARDFGGREKAAFTELNELLLASQINDVLQDFNPRVLSELMADKPDQFFKLAATINAQAAERIHREKLELEYQKYRDHVDEQKQRIQEATQRAGSKGLTPDILSQIEEAAGLL